MYDILIATNIETGLDQSKHPGEMFHFVSGSLGKIILNCSVCS